MTRRIPPCISCNRPAEYVVTADRDTQDGEYVARDTCLTHLPEEAAAHRRYLDEFAPDAYTVIGRIVPWNG